MSKELISRIITGTPISPGLAQGIIHVHRTRFGPIDSPVNIGHDNIEDEFARLDSAVASISNDLFELADKVGREIDSRLAGIFGSHQLMLNDSTLREELRKEIEFNLVNANSAVKTVFLRWEKRFMLMESQIAREKGEDMRDISLRLRNALAGITVHPLEEIPDGCVLATSRLLPSDTVFLSGRSVSAVLLEYGCTGSHAALFVREMDLPCISGFSGLLAMFQGGAPALVDADAGSVTIHPDEQQKVIFRHKTEEKALDNRQIRSRARSPAVTRDGIRIAVFANVGSREDTEKAMSNGADGVGLYRLERAYMGRVAPLTTSELLDIMRQTLEPAMGHAVYVRLMDIGADKPLPFMGMMAESNPSLGRRGIRLLREYPEILNTQLQAMLELAGEFDVHILVPMVTLPDDVSVVKDCLMQLCSHARISSPPGLGAMIETPAAALSARELVRYADFLSFGTNDLTQYAFAADRENAAVERYYNDASDVIFGLMQMTHESVPAVPLSLCGELAGCPEHVPRLLQCGISSFSVAAQLIPGIKETIRNSWSSGCWQRAIRH